MSSDERFKMKNKLHVLSCIRIWCVPLNCFISQSSSPAAVKTQVGMEIGEETEDNRADAGYETNNLENSV